MYNLTDYSLSDLRIIQAANEDQIQDLKDQIKLAEKHFYDLPSILEAMALKYNRQIAVLTEHNVHLLTAIAIVKQNETVNSN